MPRARTGMPARMTDPAVRAPDVIRAAQVHRVRGHVDRWRRASAPAEPSEEQRRREERDDQACDRSEPGELAPCAPRPLFRCAGGRSCRDGSTNPRHGAACRVPAAPDEHVSRPAIASGHHGRAAAWTGGFHDSLHGEASTPADPPALALRVPRSPLPYRVMDTSHGRASRRAGCLSGQHPAGRDRESQIGGRWATNFASRGKYPRCCLSGS